MKKLAIILAAGLFGTAAHGQNYPFNRGYADDRSYSSRGSSSGSQQGQDQQWQRQQRQGQQNQVQRLNKASNLVGTEVRLRDGQRAGKVKDVVIDFDSGRVSYVVLDAGSVLDQSSGGNLIAVPARALQLQNNRLQLDADRSRLQQVRTFSSENYPRMHRSQQQRRQQAWGTSGSGDQFGSRPSQSQFSRDAFSSGSQGQDSLEDEWVLFIYEFPAGQQSGAYGGYSDSEFGQGRQFQGRQDNRQQQPFRQQREFGFRGEEPQWHEQARREGYRDQGRSYNDERDWSGQSQQRYQGQSSQSQRQYGTEGSNRYGQSQGRYGTSQYGTQGSGQYGRQGDSQYRSQQRYQGLSGQGQGESGTQGSNPYAQSQRRYGTSQSEDRYQSGTRSQGMQDFRGEIVRVDEDNNTIRVRGSQGARTFKVSESSDLKRDGQDASLEDFSRGERVVIRHSGSSSGQPEAQSLRKDNSSTGSEDDN